MTTATLPQRPGQPAQSDPHDRALVRRMLELTPEQRLHTVSAFWPVVRVGLERRRTMGGTARP